MPSNSVIDGRGAKTILVVDDEEAIRQLVCMILRQGGYTALEARDSETATKIHRHKRGQIDLLLTDVSMPGENGCELAATLHKTEPSLQVLFMSGLPVPELLDICGTEEEGWRFLQKPFGVSELLKRVEHVLELSGSTNPS